MLALTIIRQGGRSNARRLAGAALSTSRRLPLAEDEDPFEVIGVGVEADERKIKERFYAKAKILHPDVATGRDTKEAFARLVRSYEVLIDPSLRAEYLLRKRRRNGGGGTAPVNPWRGRATRGPDPSPVEEFNASLRRGRRDKAYRARRYTVEEEVESSEWFRQRPRQRQQRNGENGMAQGSSAAGGWDAELSVLDGGLLGQLQQEFDNALLFAYLGPRVEEGMHGLVVDSSLSVGQCANGHPILTITPCQTLTKCSIYPQPKGTIPWAFECEERRPLDYAEAAGAAAAPAEDDASTPCVGALHPHILQMTSGQQLLGWVEARSDGGWTLPESMREERAGGSGQDDVTMRGPFSRLRSVEGQHAYTPLSLMWQGSLLAEAVRLRDEGKGEDVIAVKILQRAAGDEQQQQQEEGKDQEEAPCYLVRGLDTSALLSQHPIEDARTGHATHLLVCHRTPLVRHFSIVSALDRRVEVRISRGYRLPSRLWHFPPRSPDHDHGAFYVERAEAHAKRQAALLHPAVYVLLCAYKTLAREEEERRKAEARTAAPRIARMAHDFWQNIFDK